MGASETVSALSDLLNSKPVTAKQAAAKAGEIGLHLPYGTIAAYWSGSHGRPSAATLKALAQVVPLTEKQLQQAAWNETAPLGPWVPPEESIHLDRDTRKALDNLIKSVVKARGVRHDMEAAQESHAQAQGRQPKKTSRDKSEDPLKRLRRPGKRALDQHPAVSGDEDGDEDQQLGG